MTRATVTATARGPAAEAIIRAAVDIADAVGPPWQSDIARSDQVGSARRRAAQAADPPCLHALVGAVPSQG